MGPKAAARQSPEAQTEALALTAPPNSLHSHTERAQKSWVGRGNEMSSAGQAQTLSNWGEGIQGRLVEKISRRPGEEQEPAHAD